MPEARAEAAIRISSGFLLDQIRLGRRGMDLTDALILLTIGHANVEPVMRDPALQRAYATYDAPPPDELRRPISINALAQSLHLPYETVRRRVARLALFRLCRLAPEGAWIPVSVLQLPPHRLVLEAAYNRLRALYVRMGSAGCLDDLGADAPAWTGPPPLRAAARISTEYLLRLAVLLAEELDDLACAAIWMEILRSSGEHLPDRSFPVADGALRPVRPAALAKRLGMPAETLRRRVGQLTALGACEWAAGGLVVGSETLRRPGFERLLERNLANLLRMYASLGQLGVLAAWHRPDARAAA